MGEWSSYPVQTKGYS